VANNDNDDHDQCDSPIELWYDLTDLIVVLIYPHGGACFAFTKVLVVKVKNNTMKKISSIRKQMFAF